MNPLLLLSVLSLGLAQDALPGLKVSDNKRFLVTAEGQRFFWLDDTAQKYTAPGTVKSPSK